MLIHAVAFRRIEQPPASIAVTLRISLMYECRLERQQIVAVP